MRAGSMGFGFDSGARRMLITVAELRRFIALDLTTEDTGDTEKLERSVILSGVWARTARPYGVERSLRTAARLPEGPQTRTLTPGSQRGEESFLRSRKLHRDGRDPSTSQLGSLSRTQLLRSG